jgi:hypothetical protein
VALSQGRMGYACSKSLSLSVLKIRVGVTNFVFVRRPDVCILIAAIMFLLFLSAALAFSNIFCFNEQDKSVSLSMLRRRFLCRSVKSLPSLSVKYTSGLDKTFLQHVFNGAGSGGR